MMNAVAKIRSVVSRLVRYQIQHPNFNYFEFPASCQIPNLSFLYEYFLGTSRGHLVEIGAYDGISFSNSSGLIGQGWSADLYEPVPRFFDKCQKRYQDNAHVRVFSDAVGSTAGVIQMAVAGPLSSGSSLVLDEYSRINWARPFLSTEIIEVPQVSLSEVFSRSQAPIDLLIVDVEGGEPDVLRDLGRQDQVPRMMIVEMADTHPDLAHISAEYVDLTNQIIDLNYYVLYKDHINTVFVQKDVLQKTF